MSQIPRKNKDLSNVIELKNIEKSYEKNEQLVEAIRGVSLEIRENEIFALLGPNGAGKTTLLRIIVGLLKPDKGEVSIFGKKVDTNRNEIKKRLGIIPQSLVFYPDLTVEENLQFITGIYDIPNDEAEERIEELLKTVGLIEKRKSIARNLSGGLQRRLNLILGLIHNPTIVLCDEPTPGLDPQSRIVVWDLIKSLPEQGKTVILTTHFMEEADRLSNRIAIIDHGKILVLDESENLKASIGKGDILEVSIGNIKEISSENILSKLKKVTEIEDVTIIKDKVVLRALNIVPRLSKILNQVEDSGIIIENLSLRNTTLEDVFITLTGRTLRD
ncbi:MAG: ABC transporter ATP-binding protein [Candidatus Hodarchaeales archaeon]|jgi:ABC-2 type transport system ATP-binding protein